jgi:uncharacterized protein
MYQWGHSRRFNSYTEYFRRNFGGRVQKLTLDAGFSCPNRDGTVGVGGCTYCNNDAFNPSYCTPAKTITTQLSEGVEFHKIRYRRAANYLAYFQAYSNTHSPLAKLKELYNEALSFPDVIGLVIGTRPDCVDAEKLDYFAQLAEKHYVIIEYGVESCYDRTLQAINRGHNFETSVKAIEETSKRGIKTGAHVIIGLPGETEEDILNEIPIINQLSLNTIKFHQLQIIKGTALEKEFLANNLNYKHFELDEYIDFIVKVTSRLNPNFVIERIAAEVPPRFLAGPGWGLLRIHDIMKLYEKRLEELDVWQGKLYNEQLKMSNEQ